MQALSSSRASHLSRSEGAKASSRRQFDRSHQVKENRVRPSPDDRFQHQVATDAVRMLSKIATTILTAMTERHIRTATTSIATRWTIIVFVARKSQRLEKKRWHAKRFVTMGPSAIPAHFAIVASSRRITRCSVEFREASFGSPRQPWPARATRRRRGACPRRASQFDYNNPNCEWCGDNVGLKECTRAIHKSRICKQRFEYEGNFLLRFYSLTFQIVATITPPPPCTDWAPS